MCRKVVRCLNAIVYSLLEKVVSQYRLTTTENQNPAPARIAFLAHPQRAGAGGGVRDASGNDVHPPARETCHG